MNDSNLIISPDYPPPLIGGSLVYLNNLVTNSNLDFTILSDKKSRKNIFVSPNIDKQMRNKADTLFATPIKMPNDINVLIPLFNKLKQT